MTSRLITPSAKQRKELGLGPGEHAVGVQVETLGDLCLLLNTIHSIKSMVSGGDEGRTIGIPGLSMADNLFVTEHKIGRAADYLRKHFEVDDLESVPVETPVSLELIREVLAIVKEG